MYPILLSLALFAPHIAENKHGHAMKPVTCDQKLEQLLAAMKNPANNPSVSAETSLIVGGTSYAEYTAPCTPTEAQPCFGDPHPSSARPFVVSGSIANSSTIAGISEVASHPNGKPHKVTFFILEKEGRARLQWVVEGKRYDAAVSSCSGGIWTASTSSSAIATKLGAVHAAQPVPS